MTEIAHRCISREHGWAGKSERGVLTIASPVDDDQLRKIGPTTVSVQWECPLSDAELEMVAAAVSCFPSIYIRRFSVSSEPVADLRWLRHFPAVRRIGLDLHGLKSPEGIEYLSEELETLSLGECNAKRLSLAFLRRFLRLKVLHVHGWKSDLETISELQHLDFLNLRAVPLPSLDFLVPLSELTSLGIQRGSLKDLSALPKFTNLKILNLWAVNGLVNLEPISRIASLQWLCLDALSNVTSLPDFKHLRDFRRLELKNLKRLSDLSPLAEAPAIEQLQVLSDTLKAQHFESLSRLRPLLGCQILLGSDRESKAAFEAMGQTCKPLGKFVVR